MDASGQLLGSPTSYHAALKAAYQICDYRSVIQIYESMEKKKMKMARPVVYIVSEVGVRI